MTSKPNSSNVEDLVAPQIRRVLASHPKDLRRIHDELGRLRLNLKVKQLDIAGLLKWADQTSLNCEYRAFEALLANYTEALHLVDHVMISLEALNDVAEASQSAKALEEVLANAIPFEHMYVYQWTADSRRFRLLLPDVRDSSLEDSPLVTTALRTMRHTVGLERDPKTGSPTRQLCIPLKNGGAVRHVVICSGIPPHLHRLSSAAKLVLTLIEEFFAIEALDCSKR